jgi:hypothetical protein
MQRGRGQLFLYLFQYLYMSDLWVASYTDQSVLNSISYKEGFVAKWKLSVNENGFLQRLVLENVYIDTHA